MTLNFDLKRTATVSLLALTLAALLAGCETPAPSPTAGPTGSNTSAAETGASTADEKAAGAKSAMDNTLIDVKAELPVFRSKITKDMSEADIAALIEASFPKTMSHLKKDAFTPKVRAAIVNSLGQPYLLQGDMDVESKLADYKVNADAVVFSARDFYLWFGGKAKGEQPVHSGEPSKFTFTQEEDQWVISGYDSGR